MTYPLVHVALSLVGIATGFIVLSGLWLQAWSVSAPRSGPRHRVPMSLLLGHGIGARYPRHLVGGWARVYAIGAVVALYLNVFVLVVQAFLKAPALNALAPTQSEPPFLVAQLVVLMLFVGLGIVAARRFKHPV